MDVFAPSVGDAPLRPMGRDTALTVATKPDWEARIAAAPHVFSGAGAKVQVSPPIQHYCIGGFDNQWVGMCVGKATKNAAGILLRIPEGATYDPDDPSKCTPRLANRRLSGLYSYILARRKSAALGLRLGSAANDPNGGGAVVAHALLALLEAGVVPEELYPDSEANQRRCTDRAEPPGVAEGRTHRPQHALRITSRAQYFDYLAQGLPIVDGVPCTDGWMRTAEDGRFSLRGRVIGGHATVTCQFDRRRNRLYKRNSWLGWGAVTADVEFAGDARGRDNVGWCPLDEFEDTHLTDARFRSGETDAFVIVDDPAGFPQPKITPVSHVGMFT